MIQNWDSDAALGREGFVAGIASKLIRGCSTFCDKVTSTVSGIYGAYAFTGISAATASRK